MYSYYRLIARFKLVQFLGNTIKAENLPAVYKELKDAKALDIRTIDMAQGQKKSRIVTWTFISR